jgi:GGDEF domain-containing protein
VRHAGMGAMLLLDLDDFKRGNDTLGYVAGNKLLAAIAGRLEEVARTSDSLCRFGGDESIYLVESLTAPEEDESVAWLSSTRWSNRFRSSGRNFITTPVLGSWSRLRRAPAVVKASRTRTRRSIRLSASAKVTT